MIKKIVIYIVFLFLCGNLLSQTIFPPEEPVFVDTIVPRIDILIEPDSLNAILSDVSSYHEYPATFIFKAGNREDTVCQVGFRLRGNTSRYSPKKSFKVSFNTFIPGRKFHGLEKLNINGEHNDPSVIRAKLCWDILRDYGIPGPRSNHVELYINGEYYGLYINVEHIDEEFVESRFGNQGGNLYKCLWPADLNYFSNNPNDYKFESGNRRAYDLRTNDEWDNYDDLYRLINTLNNTPLSSLACEIEKVFNVESFLKILAFDVMTGNWDGYSYNKNNYYLYHNTETGKFEFIPYDLDNTLGIDWVNRDWGIRNIYDWAKHEEPRPLHNRILSIPEYRDKYSYYIDKLITEFIDTTTFFYRIDSIRTMIAPYLENDPFYPLNYGYSMDNFHQSFDQPLGGHVPYGLKPYITTRIEYAKDQLSLDNTNPVINYIRSNHPRLQENPVISAYITDDEPIAMVEIVYSVNGGPEESADMNDDGTGNDPTAGDHVYTTTLDPLNSAGDITFQVVVKDQSGLEIIRKPCSPEELNVFENLDPDLVINEFMAGNDLTFADDYGEYDDWIEIYNRDLNAVWLGDKYLSDDIQNPDRWLMPDSLLNPGDFILIWTDGQNEQGPIHANFRLKKAGEEIGIFQSPERNSLIIDYHTFGAQMDDISFGRVTDGGSLWTFFGAPTPGYSNTLTSVTDEGSMEQDLIVYPNPVQEGMVYFNKEVSVRIYDITGKLWLEKENSLNLEVGQLTPGIYIIKTYDGEIAKIVIQ